MELNGSLTSLEAMDRLGILSFAKRICEMKSRGHEIETEWEEVKNRYGEVVRVKRYYLVHRVD